MSEASQTSIRVKDQVPSYYANVKSGSIYSRKFLSMLGLRNLVFYGPEIFFELKQQLFSSDPGAYPPKTGLDKMKFFTGNTVDLDTVVLRCNDPATLKTINDMNRSQGLPVFASVDELGQSRQADEMARNAAVPLLQAFVTDFRLNPAQCMRRGVDVATAQNGPIPVVHDNSSRGQWPLWHYTSRYANSYHANVPHLPDVIGALLHAPFAAALAYAMVRNDPVKLAEFYEDGISDSCFNAKWKALEEFNEKLANQGTIKKLLEETQAAHQHIFTSKFFANDDDQNTHEIDEMWRLVLGKQAKDRTGTFRTITHEDVEQWVRNPELPI